MANFTVHKSRCDPYFFIFVAWKYFKVVSSAFSFKGSPLYLTVCHQSAAHFGPDVVSLGHAS